MRRGMTSVMGVLLLVVVVVVVGSVVAVGAFTFLDATGAPQATADFSYEQTSAGLRMTPEVISTPVTVQLNGRDVATFEPDSAGQSVLLPTAPDDRVTVVSTDDRRSLLVDEEIDERSEVGDFIAYYRFDSGSGDTLVDRSGNDNDGELLDDDDPNGGPEWTGCGLRFDGDSEYVTVADITTEDVSNVEEFTIAVTYTQTGSDGRVNQLVEHRFEDTSAEWFIETSPDTSSESYSDGYSVDYAVEYPNRVASSTSVNQDTRHVVVGTYDGNNYDLYVDGEPAGSGSHSQPVEMGELRIGRDYESENQYLDGEICEMRLYYTAFDESEVEVISSAMA